MESTFTNTNMLKQMKDKLTAVLFRLKMHTVIFSIILLFFNSSCNPGELRIDNDLSYIHLDSLSERNIILDNLNNCRFVKLQTTDDCLIKWIAKMDFDDNKIFIKDANLRIFVFDEEGRFLNTIGSIGAGPDEQSTVSDFYLDKKSKLVTIFDIHKSILFRYTYSGDLKGKEKFSRTLFSNVSAITPADDSHLILTLNNDNTSLFNFGVLDLQKKKRTDDIPYPATGNRTLSFGISKIDKSKGSVSMCAFMSDTIYTYDTDSKSIIPEWVFKGRFMPATQKDVGKKTYDLAMEAFPVARNKHLSTGINQLYTTDNYIHFTFSMDNSHYYRVFFNTETRTGSYYKITPAGLYTSLNKLIATTDDAFVCFIQAYEALSKSSEGHPNLKEILDITLEDDNPILAFYYLN